MTINFEADQDFSPLDEGTYQATVFEAKHDESNSGKRNINVQFRVSSGDYTNRRVFERYWLTPKALWRLKQLLVATGNMEGGFAGQFDEDTIPGLLAGEAVTIEVGLDTYEGKTKNVVNSVAAALDPVDTPF